MSIGADWYVSPSALIIDGFPMDPVFAKFCLRILNYEVFLASSVEPVEDSARQDASVDRHTRIRRRRVIALRVHGQQADDWKTRVDGIVRAREPTASREGLATCGVVVKKGCQDLVIKRPRPRGTAYNAL